MGEVSGLGEIDPVLHSGDFTGCESLLMDKLAGASNLGVVTLEEEVGM